MKPWHTLAGAWLCAILVTGCAAHRPLIVEKPEPKNYAWWLRSEIRPVGSAVRDIPVRDIDASWCQATEYSPDLFPSHVRYGTAFPLDQTLKRADGSFSVAEKFGRREMVDMLVGAYQKCSGEQGTFLLALENSGSKPQPAAVAEFPGSPRFAFLRRLNRQRIQLWWCFACNQFVTFAWDETRHSLKTVANWRG